ncbi:MAG TPA: RbsD/FucU domain-containing protein [Geminicoccaceae bacterium]|nr:RbsD/FucU domain-containing protein [Geminicoccaceae bacterium]
MLIGLDPLLNGELLAVLREMGHGDTIAIVDANFPAHFLGPPVLRIDSDIVAAGRAVLSLFPLDAFVDWPLQRMEVIGRPQEIVEAQAAFSAMVEEVAGEGWPVGSLERFAFYEAARDCVAVIATLDRRPYANFILAKGVIAPDGAVVRSGQGTRPQGRRALVEKGSRPRLVTRTGRR